jgi:predicted metal-binding protein
MKSLGIIICQRYGNCAGGKCLRALENREGAFGIYSREEVRLVGYTTCGGCPGGNVEYAPGEMKRNGAQIIHLATGLLVGYPPCPRLRYFMDLIPAAFDLEVVAGTHPIPENYYLRHTELGTWDAEWWKGLLRNVMADRETRLAYD